MFELRLALSRNLAGPWGLSPGHAFPAIEPWSCAGGAGGGKFRHLVHTVGKHMGTWGGLGGCFWYFGFCFFGTYSDLPGLVYNHTGSRDFPEPDRLLQVVGLLVGGCWLVLASTFTAGTSVVPDGLVGAGFRTPAPPVTGGWGGFSGYRGLGQVF